MSAVSEIMSEKPVVTVTSDSGKTAKDVAKLMIDNRVGAVIVIDKNDQPLGIVTERDMLKRVSLKDVASSRIKVEDIMTSPLITVMAYDSVDTASRVMVKSRIKRLVVMEADNKIAGIASATDIVKNLAKILTDDQNRFKSLRFAIDLQE